MKKLVLIITLSFGCLNLVQPQVTFKSNGQQLNNAVGRGVILNDFNGDKMLDAFVSNESDCRIYFGDGQGNFSDSGQRLIKPEDSMGNPAIGDINNDGKMEIITGSMVWKNNGKGIFSSQKISIKSSEPFRLGTMQMADLNGDGNLDLFALHSYLAGRVYLNDGKGNLTDTGQRLGDGTIGKGQLANIALGDINGDGYIDAITAGWKWNGSAECPNHCWLNDGKGNFTDSGQLFDEARSHVHGLALNDLNRDNHLDLIMAIQDSDRSGRIYLNDGKGHFVKGINLGGSGGESIALADFNSDGFIDFFVAKSSPPCMLWLNDGKGNFIESSVRLGNNCCWDADTGDINADGKPDVFTVCCSWGNNGLGPAPAQIWLNTSP